MLRCGPLRAGRSTEIGWAPTPDHLRAIKLLRHAAYLHDLTDAEAGAVGRAMARLARGLRAELEVKAAIAAPLRRFGRRGS